MIIDAVGPDTFTFEELVQLIAHTLKRSVLLTHTNPGLAFYAAKLLEPFLGDVLLTRDEVDGLMANLLISRQTLTGHTHLAA